MNFVNRQVTNVISPVRMMPWAIPQNIEPDVIGDSGPIRPTMLSSGIMRKDVTVYAIIGFCPVITSTLHPMEIFLSRIMRNYVVRADIPPVTSRYEILQ